MDAMPRPEGLRGERYIAYARCASKQGSTQSLRRQLRLVRQFADRLKMRCVDEVRFPGLSGHAPLLRWDLSMLLARKCNEDDYDVLVMEDPARLTRADGAGRLEALFMLCGVQIVYVATGHADGAALPAKETPAVATRFRGVAYYRHSAKQQQKDSVTIQQEQVQKWAKKNGVALIRDFTERGKTTKSARRR